MSIKPQDILFIFALVLLLYKRNPNYFTIVGLICLAVSMPLYYKWIFFTAQRFTLYAFIFLVIAVLLNLIKIRHNK